MIACKISWVYWLKFAFAFVCGVRFFLSLLLLPHSFIQIAQTRIMICIWQFVTFYDWKLKSLFEHHDVFFFGAYQISFYVAICCLLHMSFTFSNFFRFFFLLCLTIFYCYCSTAFEWMTRFLLLGMMYRHHFNLFNLNWTIAFIVIMIPHCLDA